MLERVLEVFVDSPSCVDVDLLTRDRIGGFRHRIAASARSPSVAARVFDAFERFLHIEAISGIVLLTAAIAALLWANSPLPTLTRASGMRH